MGKQDYQLKTENSKVKTWPKTKYLKLDHYEESW